MSHWSEYGGQVGEGNDQPMLGSIDPRFLDNTPPEPFSMVMPGECVSAGDIFKDLDEAGSGWKWASGSPWVGEAAPKTRLIFARLCPPEGFFCDTGLQGVRTGDVYWDGQQWVPFEQAMSDKDAAQIAGQATGGCVYIAKRAPAGQMIEVPPHHRLLWTSDTLRRGDKMSIKGDHEWSRISDTLKGGNVAAPSELNSFVRFCRETSMNHQNWYVGEGGREDAVGSTSDPFPSLDVAKQQIEKTFSEAGQVPHGTIWTVQGAPLMVYDLPEPGVLEPTIPMAPLEMVETPEESPKEKKKRGGSRKQKDTGALEQALDALREAEDALDKARKAVKDAIRDAE